MKKITRRTFMKVMGTTAAAVGLSACGGSAGSTRCLRIQRSFFDSSFCTGRGRSTYL